MDNGDSMRGATKGVDSSNRTGSETLEDSVRMETKKVKSKGKVWSQSLTILHKGREKCRQRGLSSRRPQDTRRNIRPRQSQKVNDRVHGEWGLYLKTFSPDVRQVKGHGGSGRLEPYRW